jgi:hypothetical protein
MRLGLEWLDSGPSEESRRIMMNVRMQRYRCA